MEVMITAIRMCYQMVRDVDIEQLEQELQELEKQNAAADKLPYRIEDE